jgi:serine/threonine protein kinase
MYLAPEILAPSEQGYGKPVDAWALGVVFYIVQSGQFPFCGTTNEEYYKNVAEQALDFPESEWRHVRPEAKDMIERLLNKDPGLRLTVEDALRHEWLREVAVGFEGGLEEKKGVGQAQAETKEARSRSLRFGKRKQAPAEILGLVEDGIITPSPHRT